MTDFIKPSLKRNRDEDHPLLPSKKFKIDVSQIRGQGPAERFAVIQRFFQLVNATHALAVGDSTVQIPEDLVGASEISRFVFDGAALDSLEDDKFTYGKQQAEVFLSAILSYADAFPVCDLDRSLHCCQCHKTCAETPYLLTRSAQDHNTSRCSITTSDSFVSRPLLVNHQPDPQRCDGEAVCINCLWSSFIEPSLGEIDFLKMWCNFDSAVSDMALHVPSAKTCLCSLPLPNPKHAGSSQSHSLTCLFEFSVVTDDPLIVLKKQALQALRAAGSTSHFVYDEPDLMSYIKKRSDSRNAMDEHIASLSQLLHQFGTASPTREPAPLLPPALPSTEGTDHQNPFSNTIKLIEEYRHRVQDSDGQDEFILPFFVQDMNRMLQCRNCGNFGHESGRSCPLLHASFFPKNGTDFSQHHREFYQRNVTKAKSSMLEFTNRIQAFLGALANKMQQPARVPGQLKSREIYNADGNMLQRQIDMGLNGKSRVLATTKKEKCPPDGSENPHNRIRNCFQKKERNMNITAWFGAPFSYLEQMVDNNCVPSTFLDMSSFSNPVEMGTCIATWREKGYDTSDMENFLSAFTTPLFGIPDTDHCYTAADIMVRYAHLIDINTGDSNEYPLTEYGQHLKIERAHFFDNMIFSSVQLHRTNELLVHLDYVTVYMNEERVMESLRINREFRPTAAVLSSPTPSTSLAAPPPSSSPAKVVAAPAAPRVTTQPSVIQNQYGGSPAAPDEFPVPVNDPDYSSSKPQSQSASGEYVNTVPTFSPFSPIGGEYTSNATPLFGMMTPAYGVNQFAYASTPSNIFVTPAHSMFDMEPLMTNIDLDIPTVSPRKKKAYKSKNPSD